MNKDANKDPPSTPATTREAEAAIPAGLAGLEVESELLDDATVITMSTDPVAVLSLVPDAAFAVVDSE